MTKQRKLIYEVLQESEGHLDAYEIHQMTKKKLPSIVVATVYNNLNSMCQEGIIRKIRMLDQAYIFDKNTHDHAHLICERCGKINDIEIDYIPNSIEKITNEKINSYELNAYYVCEACKCI